MHFHVMFAPSFLHLSEAQCADMLFRIRWPEGYRCPRCQSTAYSVIRTRRLPLYECAVCRKQCSVISGTVMERSRTPLSKWFTAASLIAYNCVSAVYLSRRIGVTYKTAWLMLHKLRNAMAGAVEGDLLTGLVRLDLGKANRRLIPSPDGLHPTEHPYIIGASMNGAGEPERVRIAIDWGGDTYLGKITPEGALRFIGQHVDKSASVDLTVDDWGRTGGLAIKKVGWSIEDDIRMFHHTVGAKHLHYYLQEGVYRYNTARSGTNVLTALMRVTGSGGAPDRRAIVGRPVPPQPDWTSYRDVHRMIRKMRELAAERMPGKSSA
ncbi:hypothetical protein Theco_3887 [Thermobacillus composti KWC4]|jgi:transposase-like protein|uniref:Transposase zinc-ribbon domain-containing protein n=1 Tax=Thermobacillus composti (strain DSM 18247 / JCM 13945 / KWC4) TaxID=717605 RepID=L0EI27_THECK|nr:MULTISPECIES: transposase [Thermobacillus]AGA59898.1 hypothetical protein Theco_3887 [Thermobacillus composti KWC4]